MVVTERPKASLLEIKEIRSKEDQNKPLVEGDSWSQLQSFYKFLPFPVDSQLGLLRSADHYFMRGPAQFLLDHGWTANGATVVGAVLNIGGQAAVLKAERISEKIKECTAGRLSVSPSFIKAGGLIAHVVGLGFDLIDGRMTKLPGQKPTKLGAGLDHTFDKLGGATATTIIMSSMDSTREEVEAAALTQFLAAEVSSVRAFGEANGIKMREQSIGSMLARIPGMIGAMISRDHKEIWLNVVSAQAGATVVERLWTVYLNDKSENKGLFKQACEQVISDYGVYEIARSRAGRGFGKTCLTLVAAVGPSILSKIRKINS